MTESAVFLSVNEFARLTNVSRTATYALVAEGKIPSVRIGGSIRIPRSAIDELVASAHQAVSK